MRHRGFIVAGLLVSLLLAGVVSSIAAGSPDGLEHAARRGCTLDERGETRGGDCIGRAEEEHSLSDGPLADYGWRGLADGPLATGLAGVAGVLVTFGLGWGLFRMTGRRSPAGPGLDNRRGTSAGG